MRMSCRPCDTKWKGSKRSIWMRRKPCKRETKTQQAKYHYGNFILVSYCMACIFMMLRLLRFCFFLLHLLPCHFLPKLLRLIVTLRLVRFHFLLHGGV